MTQKLGPRQVLPAVALVLSACGGGALPDPRAAARKYADAVERGDADSAYAMLTSDAQRQYGRERVKTMMTESKAEILRAARAAASSESRVETVATLRFADGEQAELAVEEGEFRVGSAGALPLGARTPAQALADLRQALARRSYPGILRVLSNESKSSLENDMRSLVDGLEQPETLDVKVNGDSAEVQIPGGHRVKLKREAGVWRIEDFD